MKKAIETIKKRQEEMNTIFELKNTIEGIKSRLDEVEDQISKLEVKVEKNSQKAQDKGKRPKMNKEELREMQKNKKHNNIRIIGIPEGEEDQGIENLFEKVMMENFSNLMREKVTQIRGAERVPIKRNPKRSTARHVIIKMAKFQDKERILKAARKKQEVAHKEAPIRLAADFSMETLQAEGNGKKYSK